MSEKNELYNKYYMKLKRKYDGMILEYKLNSTEIEEIEDMENFKDLHFQVSYSKDTGENVPTNSADTEHPVSPLELKTAFCQAYIQKHATFEYIGHNLPDDVENAWLLELVDNGL